MEWQKPTRGGRPTGNPKSMFRLCNHKGGGSDRQKQCVIFIHEKVMKQLRWVVGDKVVFKFDDECVYLKRVASDGFTLSASTGGKRAESLGKMVSASIKSSKHVFAFDSTVYINKYSLIDGDVVKLIYKGIE